MSLSFPTTRNEENMAWVPDVMRNQELENVFVVSTKKETNLVKIGEDQRKADTSYLRALREILSQFD